MNQYIYVVEVVSTCPANGGWTPICGATDAGASAPCSSILVPAGSAGAQAAAGAAGPSTGDATYELWAKTATPSDAGASPVVYLGGGQNAPGEVQFSIYCYPDRLGVEWATSQALEVATTCNDGAWHHIAVTRATNASQYQLTLFFDGQQIGTKAGTNSSPAGVLTVGGWAGYLPTIADVQIDEVRISSSVRYLSSFTPSKRFTPDTSTVALYHFDEGTGTTSADSSGNGYTPSLGSSATWQLTCP